MAWPYFDVFPSLRLDYQPTFNIEQQRPPLATDHFLQLPAIDHETRTTALLSFAAVVNYSYPVISTDKLAGVAGRLSDRRLENSTDFCLALLVMGLGCASRVVQLLNHDRDVEARRFRDLAFAHFSLYLERLSIVHIETSTTATQCLFLTALFFAYLQRCVPRSWSADDVN